MSTIIPVLDAIRLRDTEQYRALRKAQADYMAPEMPWDVWVALDNFIEMVDHA